ncbi:MAG: ABC transporter substrate-binding protein [Candidatus Omnitrophica bacterium CG11_big_fil_rev_8_21_14_0_20_64_10]|nr:MAG: ABC transporter substrate-binding protein [Candidatus Omnitrophica bacterium CG11_big_fil_rev_8_21_14_0_20_64_10]
MSRTIRIGHSPDPDDAFLFYGMTQGTVKLPGIRIEHQMEGIEELNQRALRGELEMTAISLHAYAFLADKYLVMSSGASMGENYGPVIVSRGKRTLEALREGTIAVPGKLTSAALLLQLALGSKLNLKVVPFDQILEVVRDGRATAGVVIHEGQLTYPEWGLEKVLDLGVWWFDRTGGLPVPLGINVLRSDLEPNLMRQLNDGFKASLEYAMKHRAEALDYAGRYGRGLDPQRTDKFVGMYVNHLSVECRPQGAESMQRLLNEAFEAGLIPRRVTLRFVEDRVAEAQLSPAG